MSPAKDDLAELKSRLLLSSYIGRKVRLTKSGADWFGKCPFRAEKTGSFSVNDAKGFYHCFGCGEHGDVLDWWQKQEGLSFSEARDRLRAEAGAAPDPVAQPHRPAPADDRDEERRRKLAEARSIWRASIPIERTIAERYLRDARGIRLDHLPEALRFHPSLRPDPRLDDEFPALIVGVTDSAGRLVAIQRTFLAIDGSGKASIQAPRRSLGQVGQGCVKLGDALSILGIAEGVETGLSAMEMYRVPVWCALGANLGRIQLPPIARQVVLFADRGEAGEGGASKARQIYRSQGRKVAIRLPEFGGDFNDELQERRKHGG